MISPVFLLMIMVCGPCIRAITGLFLWARPMPRWVSFPWYLRVMVPLWSTVSSRTRQSFLLMVIVGCEAYWVLFRFLYWGQFVDPCLIIAGNYLVGSSVSECLV